MKSWLKAVKSALATGILAAVVTYALWAMIFPIPDGGSIFQLGGEHFISFSVLTDVLFALFLPLLVVAFFKWPLVDGFDKSGAPNVFIAIAVGIFCGIIGVLATIFPLQTQDKPIIYFGVLGLVAIVIVTLGMWGSIGRLRNLIPISSYILVFLATALTLRSATKGWMFGWGWLAAHYLIKGASTLLKPSQDEIEIAETRDFHG